MEVRAKLTSTKSSATLGSAVKFIDDDGHSLNAGEEIILNGCTLNSNASATYDIASPTYANSISLPGCALKKPIDPNVTLNATTQTPTRVRTQFDDTTGTLAPVTGLVVNVKAAGTYRFTANLFVTADGTGGHQYSISGTCTATAIVYQINSVNNSSHAAVINARQTALDGASGQAGATAAMTKIEGTITVNAAGTLTVNFAQNTASGTSSVLVGSTFEVNQVA